MGKDYLCANYYGHIQCTNFVTGFGQRCKLCTLMNEGASMKPDLLTSGQRFHSATRDHSSSRMVQKETRKAHAQHA